MLTEEESDLFYNPSEDAPDRPFTTAAVDFLFVVTCAVVLMFVQCLFKGPRLCFVLVIVNTD